MCREGSGIRTKQQRQRPQNICARGGEAFVRCFADGRASAEEGSCCLGRGEESFYWLIQDSSLRSEWQRDDAPKMTRPEGNAEGCVCGRQNSSDINVLRMTVKISVCITPRMTAVGVLSITAAEYSS